MSNQSSSEKTEKPTPKKIRDARKKGQVSKSTDVTSTALLVVLFALTAFFWEKALGYLKEMILLPIAYMDAPFKDGLSRVISGVILESVYIVLPYIGAVIIVGIFANYLQVGPVMAFEGIKPDFKKLNPVEKLKQIFSVKNFVEFLKSVLKVIFLSILIYMVVESVIDPLLKLPYLGKEGVLELLNPIMKVFCINVLIAYIIVASFDFFFQKKQHIKQLMMTKDEVKREYKEMEGDPMIKGKRKQLHRELSSQNTMETVKKSTAVVSNPTHYAVAMLYDGDKVPLPLVTAKGSGPLALAMLKIAEENNIPIMRNVWLAHALYDETSVNEYIPSELIEPVAEVMKWVQDLKEQGQA